MWIGHGGPIVWSACSPNQTPLDYFLWDHKKNLVYEIPVDSEKDLLAQVMAAVDVGLQGIGDLGYQNMVRRHCLCVEVTSRYIKPFL